MKILSLLLIAVLFAFGYVGISPTKSSNVDADTVTVLLPAPNHYKEVLLINNLLTQHHYRKVPLQDSLSSVIFDNYINSLDPNKEYFFKNDIEYFEKYRLSIDDDLSKGNLDLGFQIFRVYRERANDRIQYAFELLKNEPDFSIDEELEFDREKLSWSENKDQLNDFWRKKIKSYALNLKLRNKEWKDTQETLINRYKNFEKSIRQYNSNDVFEIYINSYTSALDPHTSYFSPVSSDRFKVNMSHSLEGIGARLVQDVDYTKVYEVVPGGPAFTSKNIFKDDIIVGVAQGDDGEFLDVVGWRLDEVVEKIKGPKGTVVQLLLVRKGKSLNVLPDTLRLVRDKIKLEEQDSKAEIIPFSDGNYTYKLGVITIPDFYISFEDAQKGVKDYKSVTRDVKALIADLQKQGMQGLMIDLRNNGGGALQEAIDLTGLFIENGPVVQVRNTRNQVNVEKDEDSKVYYDGPLAVLTNRYSASASEIFAGAIQDYKRGIVVGETTFGKGSVQNLVGLDQFLPGDDVKLGQLKLTLAKYYRVTGSSTQNIGVVPDVAFPSLFDPTEFGEASEPNPLPWDQVNSASFRPTAQVSPELVAILNKMFLNDLKQDNQLAEMVKNIEKAKADRAITTISLNYEKRKQEMDAERAISNSSMDEEIEESELVTSNVKDLPEKLKKDAYLKESLKLLGEMVKYKKIG